MAIVTKVVSDLVGLRQTEEARPESKIYNATIESSFDDRTFAGFPEPVIREFLQNCVANGTLPSTRSPHDRAEFTDTTLTVHREWLDRTAAQEFIDLMTISNSGPVISAEIIEI